VFCVIDAMLFSIGEAQAFCPSQLLYQNPMKAELIQAASEVITNSQILVNVVSRRVRQLSLGHRPLVQVPPGMLAADIALTEIIEEKLTFESTFGQDEANNPIVAFPEKIASTKKAA
jgi:DNA-directed RNA polymerase subunit omega